MNLSEALDAALPEIPRARLTRVRPPCLDPELIVREDTLDGEPIVGAFQRSQGNYFRFPPLQWELAQLFDGVRSYEEIAALFTEKTGAALGADDARQFAQNMDEADFWYRSPQERNIALNQKLIAQRERRAKRKSKINFAHISFTGWDPDRYLTWLDEKIGGFVYSRWCFYSVIALFLFEALVFIAKWHVLGPDIPLFYNFTKKSFLDLVQFWMLFLFLGFFHETAHGLTCKHYGGEVHKMGLMLIYLTPAFFVDVTETWVTATRLQRLATIIAGIWIEMIFCGIAMIIWTNTQPGQWWHDFSYEIILITGLAVIVVNLNPLIKLDGYYFFTELIGIPDLKERSTAFVSGSFQRRVLGLPVEVPAIARKRIPLFVLYAILSGAYSYLLLFTVIRFTYNIGYNWFAEFAVIPAGGLAFTVFRSRLASLREVSLRSWRQVFPAGKPPRLQPAAVLVLLVAVLFVPLFRDQENAYFVIEPQQTALVHSSNAGMVTDVLAREGEVVHAGQPLVELRSPAVQSLSAGAAAAVDQTRFQAVTAAMAQGTMGSVAAARDAARRSTSLAQQAERSLVLRAPTDGVVLTRDPAALVDQSVGTGQALLSLADNASPPVARLFVPAAALDRIPPNAAVTLFLPGRFHVLHLTLARLDSDAVPLPEGLIARQDYKGIVLPTFYSARLELPASATLALGTSGEAKVFGPRRSLMQRIVTVLMNLVRAYVW